MKKIKKIVINLFRSSRDVMSSVSANGIVIGTKQQTLKIIALRSTYNI